MLTYIANFFVYLYSWGWPAWITIAAVAFLIIVVVISFFSIIVWTLVILLFYLEWDGSVSKFTVKAWNWTVDFIVNFYSDTIHFLNWLFDIIVKFFV